LWRLEAKARSTSVGKFNLTTLFAALKFCQMLFASLVFWLLRSFDRAFDNPFIAVPRFFEAAANRLEAQNSFFSQCRMALLLCCGCRLTVRRIMTSSLAEVLRGRPGRVA
jgi:hypothetical protein